MKPPSVQDKVLVMLKAKPWVARDEFERAFPEKVEGHASWPQRLRDLRLPKHGGYEIIYRTKTGTKHLTEWHIEGQDTAPIAPPETPVMAKAPVYFPRGKQMVFV